jgi:E3 Ubiquitin ligase
MSSSDDGKLVLYATLGFGAGIFWFFKGFKIYREYRVLADTPEIPIRSMPMGLVEIHGKAQLAVEKLVDSPVTRTPCLYYKVDIERYHRDSKGNGSWSHFKTSCDGAPFYLDDGTGKVLVNPSGAEYDLIQTIRRETGSFASPRPNFGKLLSGIDPSTPGVSVSPGGFVSDSELIAFATTAASSSGMSFSLGGAGLSLGGGGLSLGGVSLGLAAAGSRYRFTEYLILPDHWYDVTGTCAENPSPKDESDRNLITKGQNEPTFVISWRNEKGIEGELRKRAAKYVLGGAALAVACMTFLLAKFGWLF